jgi:hypothetical protein
MKTLLATGLAFLLATFSAIAQENSSSEGLSRRFKNLGFHAGSHTEFYDAVQIDDQGSTEKFGFNPLLGFSTDFELRPTWRMIPELNWVLPRDVGTGVTENLFMFRTDFAWLMSDMWRFRIGTSVMVNLIRGSGGTQEMNNGNGTSKFYIPAESRTAINNTLDLGAEAMFDSFAVRFQTYIYSLLKPQRRQVSYSLMLSYYYDLGE